MASGLPTDLALEGDGFFTVDTSKGIRYTRNGSFSINADGYLTTAEGDIVLGEAGALKVENKEFSVKPDGVIVKGQQEIGKLDLVAFNDRKNLEKEGDNYFFPLSQAVEKTPDELKVAQGILEESNIDQVGEMIALMESLRAYEASQRMISSQDNLLDITVNQLGSLK